MELCCGEACGVVLLGYVESCCSEVRVREAVMWWGYMEYCCVQARLYGAVL